MGGFMACWSEEEMDNPESLIAEKPVRNNKRNKKYEIKRTQRPKTLMWGGRRQDADVQKTQVWGLSKNKKNIFNIRPR